jgi:hypothetical protein
VPGIAPKPALPPSGATTQLPKATVQLQPPTSPIGAGVPAPTIAAAPVAEETEEASPLEKILAGVGLVAALVLLALQLSLANTWISAPDNPNAGSWGQLF